MTFKTILFGAASALVLSAGAANAVPATAETALNVRSGPGTQYQVVGAIPAGATVDVATAPEAGAASAFPAEPASRTAAIWRWAAADRLSRSLRATPTSEPYDDDYYDYGYAYGPSVGFGVYASPGYRYRHGWRGGRHWQGGGNWAGRPGGGNWAGRPGGGNWAGRPGGINPASGRAA